MLTSSESPAVKKNVEKNIHKPGNGTVIAVGLIFSVIIILILRSNGIFLRQQYTDTQTQSQFPTEVPPNTPTDIPPTPKPTYQPPVNNPNTSDQLIYGKVMGCLNAPSQLVYGESSLFCGPPGHTPYFCSPIINPSHTLPEPYICGFPGNSQSVSYCFFNPPVLMGCN